MRNYRYDVKKMIRWLMPFFLIKPKHLAWLETLLLPVKLMYDDFLVYKDQQLREATITSETNRLTRALRDKFLDETIYIIHPDDYLEQSFIYLESEGASPEFDYLDEENHQPYTFDYLDEEFNSQYDFIVRIPEILIGNADAIRAFVKKYIFSGITFTIETF
ncbi:hypothetical protein [Mucilaginibacter sp. 5C4]|uniref:hypothetical protein n=1 Tax=Mucilaginibacter sp. 5C4 TaxID=3048589 RepID=UPI002AC9D332|nr:hypothetical protein [Mucilaginibacter sp. 5C4]MEB0302401.1 hypothetical protein [Mucilaginibacter sp. 5C4]WPX22967.1 hypothetical protein RHM67_16930 [Mucilaginibacter sp. 5C4]